MRRHRIGVVAVMSMLACALSTTTSAQTADTVGSEGPQSTRSLYRVAAHFGWQWFDESAALNKAPFLGVRVSRPIGPIFHAGMHLAFSRPNSRGEYFPWNRQVYFSDASHQNDTTLLFQVNQRVTLGIYGLDAGLRFGGGDSDSNRRFGFPELSVFGGAGFYSIWLDPERVHANRIHGGLSFTLGGGVALPVGRGTTIGVRLEDVIMTNYYRNMLSLSDPLFAEDLFPNPTVEVPPHKTTVHNPRMTVSFSFIPGVKAP